MRYVAFAMLPIVLLACTEQTPVDPAETVAVAAPSFDWTNNPDVGNGRIYRGETHWVSCWSDADNILRVCHGTVPLGGGTEPGCGLQTEGDPIEWQDVVGDTDDAFSWWIHEVVKGDVFITVRDLSQPGNCFGSALVAEGWGQFQYNDNDVYGVDPDDKNANSWGFQGNGRLTAPDGSAVMYNGHLRLTYNNSVGLRGTVMVNVH